MRYIQRKYREGKVVAYMRCNKSVLRYKLCKIEKKWLTPTFRVKANYPARNPEKLNEEIDKLEQLIDDTISELLYENPKLNLTSAFIDEAIENKHRKEEEQQEVSDKMLLSFDFKLWNMQKKEELVKADIAKGLNRKLPPTIKDYISACNAIEDYEYDNNCCLRLRDVDDDFLESFKEFLASEHTDTEDHIYKCKGGMVNRTINKRLECLSAFIRSYYSDVNKAQFVFSARLSNRNCNRTIVRINKEEIEMLYNKELSNSNYNRIRDYYVFLCLTGIRFGDLISIDKNNFAYGRDGKVTFSLYSQKTNIKVEFKLTKQAKEIAERYNYKFDYYTNQAFNRTLKELFKNEGLFNDELTVYREILHQKPKPVKVRRWEKLTAHSARRTFISVLIEEGVEPIQVMNLVGHTKLSTLQIYIDKFSPATKDKISVLEF